ncbi:hypothetical protein [Rhodococcus sp. NPDC059234]|uniref:hypothetical protein n=1 Tax=Rhodococcus sp. NPDC059234 TaxID=3346781 RepID=UPI00366BFFBB
MLELLKRNYDILGTVSTGAVLWVLHAPWPLWVAWGGVIAFIAQDRIRASRHA